MNDITVHHHHFKDGNNEYYEFEGPSIRIGDFRYINNQGKIMLLNSSYVRKRYYNEDGIFEIFMMQENFKSFYPENIREFIKFKEVKKSYYHE